MGELRNTWRRFVVDGAPVALALHVVGDALCHTNPSHAKGASLGFAYAVTLANAMDAAPRDPLQQALMLDRAMCAETRQTFEFSVAADRASVRTWRGEPPTAGGTRVHQDRGRARGEGGPRGLPRLPTALPCVEPVQRTARRRGSRGACTACRVGPAGQRGGAPGTGGTEPVRTARAPGILSVPIRDNDVRHR